MIELASANCEADPRFHCLFQKALMELGRPRMAKSDAGRIIAKDYAERICKGEVSAVDGARAIWKVSLECDDSNHDLAVFGGRVSEYDGLPTGPERERISEIIVAEARELIADN